MSADQPTIGSRVPGGRGGPLAAEHRWVIVWMLLAGTFSVGFTITLLVVQLERIATELDSSVTVMTWVLTGPMLAFGVVGPAFGKMGDLWGHKLLFLSGLAVSGAFSLLSAFAWNAPSLILFRILSATAGSACGPAVMAYITQLFPGSERVKPIAYANFVGAGAPVIGVVLGGPLVDAVGWRVIFAVQAPMCLAAFVAAAWALPHTARRSGVRFDVLGSLTLGVGAASLLAGISQGRSWGWASPATVACFALSIVLVFAFVAVERRVAEPLVVLQWFRTRNFALPLLSQMLSNFAYMGSFFLIPQVLGPRGVGLSATVIGNLVISRPLAMSLLSPMAAPVTVRVGERIAGVVGAGCMLASMLLWTTVDASTGSLFIIVATGLTGVGAGVSGPALTALLASSVASHDLGVASAMQQLSTQLGAVLGSAVLATISVTARPDDLGPFHVAFVVAAGTAVAAGVVAAFVRRSAPMARPG